jgi:glycogen operon protein
LCQKQDTFDWKGDKKLVYSNDLIIYEMHVRGFTQNKNSGVPDDRRGTYLGILDKLPYLKELGVTAIELMPVFQFDPQEPSDAHPNYWGYMPLSFFALHGRYSNNPDAWGKRNEFRELIKTFHQNGFEVFLDVVYNHTAEANQTGPNYCFKGIDNSTYYMINKDDPANPYREFALPGGNTIHAANTAVRRIILDSLRYWVDDMHVDGFRFDLASILALNTEGFPNLDAPLFDEVAADPVLNQVRLIAEQWGWMGKDRAKFPGRVWLQWNGEYRDCLRRFIKSDPSQVCQLMSSIYGSCNMLSDELPYSFHPWQSINYVTSHDGFTLADLVSYNHHTAPPGDDNPQYGWDCGHPGVDGVPEDVIKSRKRQIKNFCALLMLSNGTPMIRMGDEFMQTQRGHRDPYNIDSPQTWLDWELLEKNKDIFLFFKKMIAFRKAHPSLSRFTFWRDSTTFKWYGLDRNYDCSPESRTLAFYLDGKPIKDKDIYVLINAYWQPLSFHIQEGSPNEWKKVIDTGLDSPQDILHYDQASNIISDVNIIEGRSVIVLVR